jgi:hypothetical protein
MNDQDRFNQEAAEQLIARLNDNNDLLDIMISIEDYLDNNDIYSFKNWLVGEIVGGPYVRRYWVRVTLKWDYEDMPDPSAGLRLLKHGTKIQYRKAKEKYPVEIESPSDYQPGTVKPKFKQKLVWLVDLIIPRKFVEGVSEEVLDLYDEEVDTNVADEAMTKGETPANSAVQP